MRTAILLVVSVSILQGSQWRLNPRAASANPSLRAALPDVHSVRMDDRYIYVESAGLALQSLGPLEANGIEPALGLRHFVYRFPRSPKKAAGDPMPVPAGVVGAFVNGIPLYNFTSAISWRDQNLWHMDAAAASPADSPLLSALLETKVRHSPLIGFAFDGFPIYGPYGQDERGQVRRFRPSYRLRSIARRTVLPDGTELPPSQEGPPVDERFPAGTFVEDYEYAAGSGDLDDHNGRWARTPEYPDGTYAYFLGTDNAGRIAYPYLVGPTYYGEVSAAELSNAAHADKPAPLRGPILTREPLDPADAAHIALAAAPYLRAGHPETLTLSIRSAAGRRIRYLEKVHERPIHLMAVSEDMREFAHIHPELQPDDTFTVVHTFPRAGEYWLYADYTRPGAPPSVSRFRLEVEGAAGDSAGPVSDGRLRVRFTQPGTIRTGEDLPFRFEVADTATGFPVTDLEPYLGAWAHITIVSDDKRHFIHAHPLEDSTLAGSDDPWRHTHAAPGPSPSSVATVVGFRDPGRYRMWVQFQRAGETVTIPYAFTVQPGSAATAPPEKEPAGEKGAIHIRVSRAGFEPARIRVPAGAPVRLAFHRADAENCAGAVIFPGLGIRRDLPAGRTTVVELPASAPREISFSCGMKMFRGSVVVQERPDAAPSKPRTMVQP